MTEAVGEKIRKWDEVNGLSESEKKKAEEPQEQRNGPVIAPGTAMEQDHLKNAEEQTEDDYNSIDGILNNGNRREEAEERETSERKSVMEKLREKEKRNRSIPPEIQPRDKNLLCPERDLY